MRGSRRRRSTCSRREGFDRVSIEAIARAAGVGPATIYRNFGTKERMVLWDEYDPLLLEAIAAELEEHEVLTAVQRALSASLGEIYRDDRARVLRRGRLIRATPALQVVAAADMVLLRTALEQVLLQSRRASDELAARVFAGALVATIVAGVDRWLDGDGKEPLARCFQMALGRLRRLAGA
jgi:AcrR family transcriptional regulator